MYKYIYMHIYIYRNGDSAWLYSAEVGVPWHLSQGMFCTMIYPVKCGFHRQSSRCLANSRGFKATIRWGFQQQNRDSTNSIANRD
jgi:hypothetical protein